MAEWSVPATVERVVDGDTLDLTLDLGWHIRYRAPCRIVGINTPEMNTDEGRAVRAWVLERCPVGSQVRFISKTLDKYRRPLGHVLLPDGVNLGELLLATGRAVPM